ncbi:hypothetical protein SODALDRAFT_362979 [Sodiomyces alkalinus F11]|uniref:Uncharacterized protein n=1 Tax=Sodiomyces alkalinus (strain CBS 110278 / VKM F-3762 / F11) TaxID=1314773 RepID=A0A3N2PP36_SODAK|nr:hypothetical protein SODALDRAFT_362979 [Sodiomyces alkalinus F11]ROT36116.1 hypothetical protein SODALDRAFT_362979 [Sodiomyces alkalinus F11]
MTPVFSPPSRADIPAPPTKALHCTRDSATAPIITFLAFLAHLRLHFSVLLHFFCHSLCAHWMPLHDLTIFLAFACISCKPQNHVSSGRRRDVLGLVVSHQGDRFASLQIFQWNLQHPIVPGPEAHSPPASISSNSILKISDPVIKNDQLSRRSQKPGSLCFNGAVETWHAPSVGLLENEVMAVDWTAGSSWIVLSGRRCPCQPYEQPPPCQKSETPRTGFRDRILSWEQGAEVGCESVYRSTWKGPEKTQVAFRALDRTNPHDMHDMCEVVPSSKDQGESELQINTPVGRRGPGPDNSSRIPAFLPFTPCHTVRPNDPSSPIDAVEAISDWVSETQMHGEKI